MGQHDPKSVDAAGAGISLSFRPPVIGSSSARTALRKSRSRKATAPRLADAPRPARNRGGADDRDRSQRWFCHSWPIVNSECSITRLIAASIFAATRGARRPEAQRNNAEAVMLDPVNQLRPAGGLHMSGRRPRLGWSAGSPSKVLCSPGIHPIGPGATSKSRHRPVSVAPALLRRACQLGLLGHRATSVWLSLDMWFSTFPR